MAAAIAGEDIGTAFDRCWDTVQSVLNSDAEGSAPPGAAESGPAPDAEALAQLASLVKRIRSERVLSANEELSDIPTGHIRYLLPDFWRAKILQRRHVPAQRLPALRGARAALLTFLQSLQRLGALRREEASLVGEDLIDDEEGMTFDPAQRRAYLVGRAKFRAELQGRVGSVAWSGEAEADGVGAGAGDDEDARGRRLDALQLAALEAVDDLGHIAAELPMLHMMVARAAPSAAEAHAAAAAGDGRMRPAEAERLAKEEAAIAAVTAPDRPGITLTRLGPDLQQTRETIRATLIKPGYDAPPMTMEEFAAQEVAAARARSEASKEAAKHHVKKLDELYAAGEEDDEAAHDAATKKAREWDDWCDDHTRGSGNTKRI